MNFLKATTAVLFTLVFIACSDDESTKAGNNEACGAGDTCVNNCDVEPDGCNMSCEANSKCEATCQEGQSCNFACHGTAECKFDCTAGTCNTSGDSDSCTCTGDCLGTCGGISGVGGSGGSPGVGGSAGSPEVGGSGGEAGGGSVEDCIAECGDYTDPGYVDCVAACNQ